MKVRCFYLLALLFLHIFSVAMGRNGSLIEGWQPIKDVEDPHVMEIEEFAVAEYNKASMAGLKFESAVKGETQVVFGLNYQLLISANDGAVTKDYKAGVIKDNSINQGQDHTAAN